MTQLQDDLLGIYNSLVEFSPMVSSHSAIPIKVRYDSKYRILVFEAKGKVVTIYNTFYYCLGLTDLEKSSYLLPDDYENLMLQLQSVINSGKLLENRTCLSPENYGFNIFSVSENELHKGPEVICNARLVSSNSWLFKLFIKLKYKI